MRARSWFEREFASTSLRFSAWGGRIANPKMMIATLTNETYDDRWKGVARVGMGLSYS
jgi:hypothetical protein